MKDISRQHVRRPVQRECHLIYLPQELLLHIISYLTAASRCSLRCTCRTLCAISNTPTVWRHHPVQMNSIGQYNKTMWNTIRERQIRHLTLPSNLLMTPNHWSSICRCCPDLVQLRVSYRSFLHLSEANARKFGSLRELDLISPEEWTGSRWTMEHLPALRYLTLSCRTLKNKPLQAIAKLVTPLVKLQGITLRLSVDIILENLAILLNEWPSLHRLDIEGPIVDGMCLLGVAGSKLPERHLQLDTLRLIPLSDDFWWLRRLTNLKVLSVDIDDRFWQMLFSAVTCLHKLAHLTISLHNGGGHVLQVTGRLPPLVSFTVLRTASRCTHQHAPCRLSLPSICTQVSASLRKLTLMNPRLSSSDLQCIVGHLPHLEELRCRLQTSVHGSALLILKNLRELRDVHVDCSSNNASHYLSQLHRDSDNRIRTTELYSEFIEDSSF